MVGEFYAGYKGFSAIVGLGKQFLEVKDAATRQTLVVEFTGKLMEAQQHEALLVERIRELEKNLMQFENWETEKKRYELVKLDPGVMMYRLKPGMENGEDPHEICANCYNSGKKNFLHIASNGNGRTLWKCHPCGFSEYTGKSTEPRVNRRSDWVV